MISGLFGVLFLFCAGYVLPGGAIHYSDWALALGKDTTLSPGHAQRQIMMALAYYLTGFTVTKSYVGITLLFTSLGVLMPIIVYACVSKTSKSIAFLTSLGLCFSLAPFTYIKFFLSRPAVYFLSTCERKCGCLYIWSRNAFYLYINDRWHWFSAYKNVRIAFAISLSRFSAFFNKSMRGILPSALLFSF